MHRTGTSLCNQDNALFARPSVYTEKVGSNSGGEGCSIFYLEVTGEAVLIRKTEVEETQFQSTFR